MIYDLQHVTTYTYSARVDLAHHMLCLAPRDLPWQRVLEADIVVQPGGARGKRRTDRFGNLVDRVTIDTQHESLRIESLARVAVERAAPDLASPAWENVRDRLRDDGFPSAATESEFIYATPQTPALDDARALAGLCFTAGTPVLRGARELTRRIRAGFIFDPAATEVSTPLAEVFRTRRGVCQDFAHVALASLRSLGLAARYVSGYVRTFSSDGRPNLQGGDASHAWIAVWCPDAGWVEFDPTNDLVVTDQHVTVAHGRDYADVSPIRGIILGGGDHSLSVAVRLAEVPALEMADVRS
jgi:transglutaminase-like putative cysteine protease